MGRMVEFAANGKSSGGYLATPASGSGPGVIVIQEWWGLVDHVKDVADRFAGEGFVALAPDMYHGETATSPDDAGKLMMALNIEQTERDLRGAVDYLLARDEVTGDRVGTVGFCMGGQLSLSPPAPTRRSAPASTSTGSTPTSSRIWRACRRRSWDSSPRRTASSPRRSPASWRPTCARPARTPRSRSSRAPTTPSSTTPARRCITPSTPRSAGRGCSRSIGGTSLDARRLSSDAVDCGKDDHIASRRIRLQQRPHVPPQLVERRGGSAGDIEIEVLRQVRLIPSRTV